LDKGVPSIKKMGAKLKVMRTKRRGGNRAGGKIRKEERERVKHRFQKKKGGRTGYQVP